MRLKLLYTLVLILCMSAFASSKSECTHPALESGACDKGSRVKGVSKEMAEEKQEFSTFQFVKFLYI